MQRYNKIFWRIGQEITPETYIQADNYIRYQNNLISHLLNRQFYGLFPDAGGSEPALTLNAKIHGSSILVEQMRCLGVTKNGYLIDYDDSQPMPVINKSVPIAGLQPDYYYLVIQVKPFEQQLIEPVLNEETPFASPVYRFDVKHLSQLAVDELPVLKINCRSEYPEIVKNYIPPCMCVQSHPFLQAYYQKFKPAIQEILRFLHAKSYQYQSSIYPVSMLFYEFETLPLSEPPYYMVHLLKRILKSFTLLMHGVTVKLEKTLTLPYNHDDIDEMLQMLLVCLHDIRDYINMDSVEEEDFTPRI